MRNDDSNDAIPQGVYVFESGLQSAHVKRRAAMLTVFCEGVSAELLSHNTEQAMAKVQALIEFNLNVPESVVRKPIETRLKFFEAYWDSDHQRFGDCSETSTAGWSQWLSCKLTGTEPATVASDWEQLTDSAAVLNELEEWAVLGIDETVGVATTDTTTGPAPGSTNISAIAPSASPSPDEPQFVMVYSAMHGYKIPMRVETEDDSSSAFYLKILGDLREESGSVAAAAAKAERAARKVLKPVPIEPDDPFVSCECSLWNFTAPPLLF